MKEVDQDALYQSLNEMPVSTEMEEENTALQVLICSINNIQNKHLPMKGSESKGVAVHFTQKSWDMVVNVMMGIRMAVGRVMMEPNRPLCPNDYTMKEKMTIVSQKNDNDINKVVVVLLLHLQTCRFVDYAPMVFRKLRENWGISAEEYMLSVGPQQILRIH